ncbi:MAG TPA: response regulator [Planctomycetota bacterium]|nr:response regulator [Planctomycetota bacterium]
MASPHSSPSGVTDLPSPVLGAPLLREQDRRPGEGTYVGRVVLAEDDGEMRAFLALLLRSQGLDVIECSDGEALLRTLADREGPAPWVVDLVVADNRMPRLNGLDALELEGYLQAVRLGEVPPFLLITAFGDGPTVERAFELGAAGVLLKPFDPDLFVLKAIELILQGRERSARAAGGDPANRGSDPE